MFCRFCKGCVSEVKITDNRCLCIPQLHRKCSSISPKAEQTKEEKVPEECLYYKFINDSMPFAIIDSNKASDFHWDHEVCEFFETIKYLGG